MSSLEIYPFFIECGKRCNDKYKKKILDHLALGKNVPNISVQYNVEVKKKNPSSGMVTTEKKHILITKTNQISVSTEFNQKDATKVLSILENKCDQEYYQMQDQIKEHKKSWSNIRKKDKFRFVDRFILEKKNLNLKEKMALKNIVFFALILKLVQPSDISFDSTSVKINGDFSPSFFENMDCGDVFPQNQNCLNMVWSKYCKSAEFLNKTRVLRDQEEPKEPRKKIIRSEPLSGSRTSIKNENQVDFFDVVENTFDFDVEVVDELNEEDELI
jgi:hypothetical protein